MFYILLNEKRETVCFYIFLFRPQKYNLFRYVFILHSQNMFPLNQNMTSVIVFSCLEKVVFF